MFESDLEMSPCWPLWFLSDRDINIVVLRGPRDKNKYVVSSKACLQGKNTRTLVLVDHIIIIEKLVCFNWDIARAIICGSRINLLIRFKSRNIWIKWWLCVRFSAVWNLFRWSIPTIHRVSIRCALCGAEEPSNYPFMISSAESMVRFGLVSDFVRVGRGSWFWFGAVPRR